MLASNSNLLHNYNIAIPTRKLVKHMAIPEDKKRPASSLRPGDLENLQSIPIPPPLFPPKDPYDQLKYVILMIGGAKLHIGYIEAGSPHLFKGELERHRKQFAEKLEHIKSITSNVGSESSSLQVQREWHEQMLATLYALIGQL